LLLPDLVLTTPNMAFSLRCRQSDSNGSSLGLELVVRLHVVARYAEDCGACLRESL
jgi:hypothetical protein